MPSENKLLLKFNSFSFIAHFHLLYSYYGASTKKTFKTKLKTRIWAVILAELIDLLNDNPKFPQLWWNLTKRYLESRFENLILKQMIAFDRGRFCEHILQNITFQSVKNWQTYDILNFWIYKSYFWENQVSNFNHNLFSNKMFFPNNCRIDCNEIFMLLYAWPLQTFD